MNFGVLLGNLLQSQGSVATVYELKLGNKKYIVKNIDHESREENNAEIEMTLLASDLGICPKVLSYTEDYIVMEYVKAVKITQNDLRKLKPVINKKLDILYDNGIYHGDLHIGNILVTERGRVYIIDYGLSEYSENSVPQQYRRYF